MPPRRQGKSGQLTELIGNLCLTHLSSAVALRRWDPDKVSKPNPRSATAHVGTAALGCPATLSEAKGSAASSESITVQVQRHGPD